MWCSADQSCYRDSRLVLCVGLGWELEGGEKEREEEQIGVGKEREKEGGEKRAWEDGERDRKRQSHFINPLAHAQEG